MRSWGSLAMRATRDQEGVQEDRQKYHPDLNQGDAEAEEKFKEASSAYDVVRLKNAASTTNTGTRGSTVVASSNFTT